MCKGYVSFQIDTRSNVGSGVQRDVSFQIDTRSNVGSGVQVVLQINIR